MEKQILVYSCKLRILCLVCQNVVLVLKEYNLRRHFEIQNPNLAELDATEKRLKA